MENKKNVLMRNYDVGRLLGQGNFGKVYCARNMHSVQDVAIKVVDKEKVVKVGLVDQTKREISVMKLVKHPNVIEFYEVMASKSKIYIVMEYAKGGELFKKVAKGRLAEDEARKYFQQLISAVDICHKRCIYHRDLKLENLLLDENGDLKVSDFGLSALAESKHQDGLLHTSCGTPAYAAPEVICRKGYDGEKADVWSCGVILFVLMAGYLPFHDSNLMAMYRKIRKAQYKFPNWFPQEVCGLLSEILDPNPGTRVSISKILENPWFRKGFNPRAVKSKAKLEKLTTPSVDAVSVPSESNGSGAAVASKREFAKATSLNAFDIISLSIGFDLSGLFVESDKKIDVQFTSVHDASAIISKLEEIAVHLRLEVKKKEGGLLKLERAEEDIEGPLSIDAEIFEFAPCFHLVEVKKANGDAFEYLKLVRQELRPALKDIVWAWQR